MDIHENSTTKEAIDVHAQAHLWNLIYGFVDTLILRSTIELGILDIIHNNAKPITLHDLATRLPLSTINSDRLYRILRYLVHICLIKVVQTDCGPRSYSLKPVAKLLLRNEEKSMAPIILGMSRKDFVLPWYHVKDGLGEDGSTPFDKAMGMSFFEYLEENPNRSKLFNEGMANKTRFLAPSLIKDFKMFEGIESLVDVGGGNGTTIKAISDAFPHIDCTLFDLPHVVADSNNDHPNIKRLHGDMFKSVPSAQAILLKLILHDWGDEDCVKILKKCKEAVPKDGGKVLIVDVVLNEESNHELSKARLALDMDMLVNTGGRERTKEDWEKLIKAAGFQGYKIKDIAAIQSVIEVFP